MYHQDKANKISISKSAPNPSIHTLLINAPNACAYETNYPNASIRYSQAK